MFLKTEFHVAETALELLILLPSSLECLDYRYVYVHMLKGYTVQSLLKNDHYLVLNPELTRWSAPQASMCCWPPEESAGGPNGDLWSQFLCRSESHVTKNVASRVSRAKPFSVKFHVNPCSFIARAGADLSRKPSCPLGCATGHSLWPLLAEDSPSPPCPTLWIVPHGWASSRGLSTHSAFFLLSLFFLSF